MTIYQFEIGVTFHPSSYSIEYQKRTIQLSSTEATLLLLLCDANGHTVDRNVLISTLWPGDGREGCDSNLNKSILLLRRKFESIGFNSIIKTVPRVGYLINEPMVITVQEPPTTTLYQYQDKEQKENHHILNHKKSPALIILILSSSLIFYIVWASKVITISPSPSLYKKISDRQVTIYNNYNIAPNIQLDSFLNKIKPAIHRLHKKTTLLIVNTKNTSSATILKKGYGSEIASYTNTMLFNKNTPIDYTCASTQLLELAAAPPRGIYRNLTSNTGVISRVQQDCDKTHWIDLNIKKVESNSKVNNHFYYSLEGLDEYGELLFTISYYGIWRDRHLSPNHQVSFTIEITSQQLDIHNPTQLHNNPLMPTMINMLSKKIASAEFTLLEKHENILIYSSSMLPGIPLIYYKGGQTIPHIQK